MHLGARLDMAFQIVGVQLDKPGKQQVAAAIHCTGGHGCPGVHRGNPAFGQAQRLSLIHI